MGFARKKNERGKASLMRNDMGHFFRYYFCRTKIVFFFLMQKSKIVNPDRDIVIVNDHSEPSVPHIHPLSLG